MAFERDADADQREIDLGVRASQARWRELDDGEHDRNVMLRREQMDRRDAALNRREAIAQAAAVERERAAAVRDAAADQRERLVEARNRAADRRDSLADQREIESQMHSSDTPGTSASV